jgi:hypothetical protein
MFEKIGRLAEAAATNVSVSRRGFFGQLGRAALCATAVLGGLLVLPAAAQAAGGFVCCKYKCHRGYVCPPVGPFYQCLSAAQSCPDYPAHDVCQCKLMSQRSVSSCLNLNVCGP